jgi:oligoendopeptidase F
MKTATQLRDQALEQVEDNANKAWTDLVSKIIADLANQMIQFTSDDVWNELKNYPDVQTHQPAAMGAMFKKASKLGHIKPTDSFIASKRSVSHARPIRVWTSNTWIGK